MSKLEVDEEDGGGQGPVFATAAKRLRMSPSTEPTSVLYKRSPSPSPPTSSEAPPISAEDWEAVLQLSGGDMPVTARGSCQPQEDNSFLGWGMNADGEVDDAFLFGLNKGPALDPFLAPAPCQEELQQQVAVIGKDKEVDYCLDPEAAAVEELLEAARRVEAGEGVLVWIPFQFNAVLFDPSLGISASSPGHEAVAVRLPISSGALSPATLRVVKQLRPAVVVCVDDHGCHRGNL